MEKLITNSRNAEVNDVATRIIGAYDTTGLNTDANLDGIMVKLKGKTSELTTAIKRTKADSALEGKDEIRDNAIRSLYFTLQGFSLHSDAAIQSAALALLVIFDKYGLKIANDNYAAESSEIISLLEDLASAEVAAPIAAVPGCAAIIAQLQSAQDDFENTRIEYNQNTAEEGTLVNATGMKKAVLVVINDQLTQFLDTMVMLNDAMYGAFGRTVETIINENNEVVKKRRNKNDNPEE